jgi:hypothetical protein
MAIFWYPAQLAARIPWHANYKLQAADSGVSLGLTAAQVTQIATDSDNAVAIINFAVEVQGYAEAITEWRDLIFDSTIGTPLPELPKVPTEPTIGGTLSAIIDRTIQYANLIKASPNFTQALGESYGIVSTPAPEPANPTVAAVALSQSQVQLNIFKAGYSVLAVDMKRGNGDWVQIGVSMTATFIDSLPPLVAGQPEVREYRVQGMENNQRVGVVSPIVSVVTTP